MARVHTLSASTDEVQTALARAFQSGHINFLIGSGASCPAIFTAGDIEKDIAKLLDEGKDSEARDSMYEFLAGIQGPMNDLIAGATNDSNKQSVENYAEYLRIIEVILTERCTNLLPKQATIFSTNYDLLVEKAALDCRSLRLNDGFSRVPSLDGRMEFSSRTFYTTTSNTGNLYNYKVEIPCVNLIKLHGSFSWKKQSDAVLFSVQKTDLLTSARTESATKTFVDSYAVVLPQTAKFRTTLMDSTYYELLRIYSNELDREGTLLVAFGFSFGDEHLLSVTKRALKNPTLKLVTVAYSEADVAAFTDRFDGYNNVDIIAPAAGEQLDFPAFNALMRGCLPKLGQKP
jgi:hypothetical protein